MKKMIAITGGIGSGKSSVLHYLSEMGYPIFSCDQIYREVIRTPAYIHKISEAFPTCIINNTIDRKRLGEIVFNDTDKLSLLNSIAHPLIMESLFSKMKDCKQEVAFAEVPLLFEGNYEKHFDGVIVVCRNIEERIRSIVQRDKITKDESLQRISSQFDYDNAENRFKKCNAISIDNNGSVEELQAKIKALKF